MAKQPESARALLLGPRPHRDPSSGSQEVGSKAGRLWPWVFWVVSGPKAHPGEAVESLTGPCTHTRATAASSRLASSWRPLLPPHHGRTLCTTG